MLKKCKRNTIKIQSKFLENISRVRRKKIKELFISFTHFAFILQSCRK
jgi:hypothetical protein